MRIVVALGGNALLHRTDTLAVANQRYHIRRAAQVLAELALEHQLIISHGNGPQVGLLALQSLAYSAGDSYPLDVLDAETEGMIGYLIEQELRNVLPPEKPIATLLTLIEVDPNDPAFHTPNQPIGPLYTREEVQSLVVERGWAIAPEGSQFRRVVPAPLPKRILEIRPIQWLLDQGTVVICAGGGGIPTAYNKDGQLQGVEAIIDKDRASALLARELQADLLILATDVSAVYLNWGKLGSKAIHRIPPADLAHYEFESDSMQPKVEAAKDFATSTGKLAAIGALSDLQAILDDEAGTFVSIDYAFTEWW